MSAANPPYRGRFAPTPSGHLHFGSLVAALGSWLRARSCDGVWLVRIEDLDPPREVAGASTDILDTLAAFGMESDELVMRQSTREPAYQLALDALCKQGLAFPCSCSRADLQASNGIHPAHCVAIADPSRPTAWRMRVGHDPIHFRDAVYGDQQQRLATEVGAFVVRRVEGYFAYQLAVVVDDAAQGISEVVRGVDLLDSTARQIWLQRALGCARPEYLHLPLVLGIDGRKLSKQMRALPVDRNDPLPALREALRVLGQDHSRLLHSGSVGQLLRQAVQEFKVAEIPRQSPPPGSGELQ